MAAGTEDDDPFNHSSLALTKDARPARPERGFRTLMLAQFLSALADNALLFVAIALLSLQAAPAWQVPVLQQCFVFSYILLAPFVGALADCMPKSRVMSLSNALKMAGCAAMLWGGHPLAAYALVGLGAAMYSPAKYGILTELLPAERLVMANGWMEGLTVAAIVLGAILGGALIGDRALAAWAGLSHLPLLQLHLESAPKIALLFLLAIYGAAAVANLCVPSVKPTRRTCGPGPVALVREFAHCSRLLWCDPLGRVSLAVTTLFWGAGATLRLIILAWAALALGYSLEAATRLTAVVAVGIALGAAIAARAVRLEQSVRVLPVGIAMGLAVLAMTFVTSPLTAIPLLVLIGALGGYFVVPMNALLQYRGQRLMGAGRSIAVQNFSENLSILLMLGAYALMIHAGIGVHGIVMVFGLVVTASMALIWRRHAHDQDG